MTSLKSSLSPFHPDMTLDLYNVADYVEAMCSSVPFQTEAFDHHVSDCRSFVFCTTDSPPGVSLCSCIVTRGILGRMQLRALSFFRAKAVFPAFMVISQNYNYANENPSQIKIVLFFQKGSAWLPTAVRETSPRSSAEKVSGRTRECGGNRTYKKVFPPLKCDDISL